jgi:hypothetical protein
MFRFAWIILPSTHMTDALSLRCIYMCCKVLYFILSEDDFEIWNKVENLQFQPVSCFESYIVFSSCLVFSGFVFYCTCFQIFLIQLIIYIKILLNCDWLISLQLISNSSAIFCNHSAIFCNHSAKICNKLMWLVEKQCDDKINQSV